MIDLINMTILIVDDMDSMCKSIRGMLKVLRFGKKYLFANNGYEGWKILNSDDVDIAIIDWNMPVMSGLELLSKIKQDRKMRDMPVVMVTAQANREIVAEAAESQIDAYILKPLTVKSLGDKIYDVIKKSNNPSPMLYHLRRAREFEENGKLKAAIKEAHAAMLADPESSRPLREIGFYYYKNQEWEIAEQWFKKAIYLNSMDVFAFHYLGEIYLASSKIDLAAEYFNRAMDISPRHIDRGFHFGKVLVEKNMISKALKIFNRIIEYSTEPTVLMEKISDFSLSRDLFDYAVYLMEKVLNKNPARYDIMMKLADTYDKIGKDQKALEYYLELGRTHSSDFQVKLQTAKLYLKMKQILRAEQVLKSILSSDPEHIEAMELLKKCI